MPEWTATFVFCILLKISYFSLEVFNLLAQNFAQEEVMVQQFWEQEEVLKKRFLVRDVDLRPVMAWH